MGVIEKAVAWAIETAGDNSHGYSQANRWGPDYDCSSFVIEAFEQAGVQLRRAGASYTGNMRGAMIACGFVDVTTQIGLQSGYGLQPGDVLLNYAAHTCLYVGGGRVANCRTDEGHPQRGDQSGHESRRQSYWNFPWNCVLRYKGQESETPTVIGEPVEQKPIKLGSRTLKRGMSGSDVKELQQKLIDIGYSCGPDGADGVYGNNTFRAVVAFQEDHGLTVTGEAGRETIEAFTETYTVTPEPDPEPDQKEYDLPELETGDSGPAVVLLQAALNVRGYDSGKPDGSFGPKTQAALNQFKREHKLTSDGRADAATWDALLGRR